MGRIFVFKFGITYSYIVGFFIIFCAAKRQNSFEMELTRGKRRNNTGEKTGSLPDS
jgi:hypothetical protein